jgi:hypothetical protein
MKNGLRVQPQTVWIEAGSAKPVVVADPIGTTSIGAFLAFAGLLSRRRHFLSRKGTTLTDDKKPRGERRKPSYRIKPADVPMIKKMIREGHFLNRIAAMFDVNPGRIAEIKKGKRFAEIPTA